MRQTGTVTGTKGEFATVEIMRTSACAGCSKQEGCIACKKKITARAYNPIKAKEGDRVVLESRSSQVLLYALLVFILPLVLCGLSFFLLGFLKIGNLLRFIISACIFVLIYVIIYLIADKRGDVQKSVEIVEIVK